MESFAPVSRNKRQQRHEGEQTQQGAKGEGRGKGEEMEREGSGREEEQEREKGGWETNLNSSTESARQLGRISSKAIIFSLSRERLYGAGLG